MSIGGIMRTSVSGMTAQASKLGVVAENIANSDTTGYKQSQTEFSSLILPGNASGYNSGAVEVQTRTFVSEQGGLSYTGNDNSPKKLDLAVNGNGFLAVSDGSGGNYLTRAGSFTQQADGSLVNAAGYTLMGYPVGTTGTDAVLNGFSGLQ
ncbi:MAG: flagellar hook basal-body protein, partial [Zymomonas sp.]